ncbi:hypothetical protein SAMD00019534_062690 [Acytostelium subglobosum LB1]|uniref:hypothetical protein n=1 Tax=Acytostelium subglobosum LB1 TaxID=1410327 RepID=UPI0006450059|nr:hypothetical protein SAMD00019534_062690 [Acytostelium subglobosum LB1]GAM23094.1 hypothetical protein SAMD00019534_062690 [Acytostelium subglobosum LB1]|eukprot:XP_012754321.1 hypothetical protein SAMD00019534_062690 [Acytostelium subglobosum LB1]
MLYWYYTKLVQRTLKVRRSNEYKYQPIGTHPLLMLLIQDDTTDKPLEPIPTLRSPPPISISTSSSSSSSASSSLSSTVRYHPYEQQQQHSQPQQQQQVDYAQYLVSGTFNKRTGRLDSSGKGGGWGPSDERQMAHYFNLNEYQEQMNRLRQQQESSSSSSWRNNSTGGTGKYRK